MNTKILSYFSEFCLKLLCSSSAAAVFTTYYIHYSSLDFWKLCLALSYAWLPIKSGAKREYYIHTSTVKWRVWHLDMEQCYNKSQCIWLACLVHILARDVDVSLSYNYQEFCKKKKSSTHCRGAASSSRGGKASETTVLP